MSQVLSWILVLFVGTGLFATFVVAAEWMDRAIDRHRRQSLWNRDMEDLRRREALANWGRTQHGIRRSPYDWKREGDFE